MRLRIPGFFLINARCSFSSFCRSSSLADCFLGVLDFENSNFLARFAGKVYVYWFMCVGDRGEDRIASQIIERW